MISAIKAYFRYKEMMQEGYTKVSAGRNNGDPLLFIPCISIQTGYSSCPPHLGGISSLAARLSKKHFVYPRPNSHLDG